MRFSQHSPVLVCGLLLAPAASAQAADAETPTTESAVEDGQGAVSKPQRAGAKPQRTIFGRPIEREGFHFHASLGIGGGFDTAGIFHAMEIGWSYKGYTFSFLHSLIQNKNTLWTDKDGPDEFGGFFAQVQGPLYFEDLVWKFAAGVGGTVDQPDEGGFYPHPGFGVHYGVDLHFPIWPKFGPTASLAAMNVIERGTHTFGVSGALGITVF